MALTVDIVIISYNGMFVEQAIRSINEHSDNEVGNIIVQQCKQSIPLNVNAGFARVTTDWWVLFNDDWEVIEDHWLERMMNFGRSDSEIGFLSCKVLFDTGKINHAGYFISENGFAGNKLMRASDRFLPDEYVKYAHPILIRSTMFREMGGYDAGTFEGSQFADIDFVYRIGNSEWKIFFAGSVPIIHHHNANKTTNAVRERVRSLNEERFRRKHGFAKKKMGVRPKMRKRHP